MAKLSDKIDGYTLVAKLKKARRRHPLTATEQALYHELVAVCNDVDWDDVFPCSNDELCHALNISENTLNGSRNSLVNAGLLFYRSGKSKRQFGKYSFTKRFTPSEKSKQTPSNFEVDTEGDAATNPATNPGVNPATNPADYIQTKRETETKEHPSGVPPGDEKKDVATEHWKKLVEEWFSFYKTHYNREPTFNGAATKALKRIVERLAKLAAREKFEWTEESAVEALKHFLIKALSHSDWLKRNFLLNNIDSQFDAIINTQPYATGNSKGSQSGTGQKATGEQLNDSFAKFHSR